MADSANVSSIWDLEGTDSSYEHYRTHPGFEEFRVWVDKAYARERVEVLLDNSFLNQFRKGDFAARLWELELVNRLLDTGLTLVPTNGSGPDFCIVLDDGRKIWIEAKLVNSDGEIEEIKQVFAGGNLTEYNTPVRQMALRFASGLVTKAEKFRDNYKDLLNDSDLIIIAITAFPPSTLSPDIEFLLKAVMPIEDPLVHFSTGSTPLSPAVVRPTHSMNSSYRNKNDAVVPKEFLYPGTEFPFIDGVLFSEASDLQKLMGVFSSSFDESTILPHLFTNHSSQKDFPVEFCENFYFHRWITNGEMLSLREDPPTKSS